MDYNLKIGDNAHPVEIEMGDGNRFSLKLGGRVSEVVYERISEHQLHLTIDGRRYNAFVAENSQGKSISIDGASCTVIDEDLLAQKRSGSGIHHEQEEIAPTIPSVVVAVPVSVGDKVEKGAKLIVLSAMKMETTLFAPYAGTVTKISAAVGDKVKPGDILVEIEKAAEA